MYKHTVIVLFAFILFLSTSCKLCDNDKKDDKVFGCTDSVAYNYNPDATDDDGSCDYCSEDLNSSFILITYDGGLTWDKKCFNLPIGTIWDISITDSNNIWVCTSTTTDINKAQILHSDNAGYTWEVQYDDTDNNEFFNYIEMFDENNGIAMGDGTDYYPLFLKTTDGGNTWNKTTNEQLGISGDTWRALDFVDINNGYFFESGINPQKLYKTTSAGVSWDATNFDGFSAIMKFYNKDIGIISGPHNDLFRTIDGGFTWETVNPNWDGQSWSIDIIFSPNDYNKLWLSAGDGNVYYSDDFGSTITKQNLSTEAIKIWNFYMGESTIWAAGYWKDRELFVNKDINQNTWEQIQLPLDDNKTLEGVVDGVGDNIIVLPGHYY